MYFGVSIFAKLVSDIGAQALCLSVKQGMPLVVASNVMFELYVTIA